MFRLLVALAATTLAADRADPAGAPDRLAALVVDRIAAARAEAPVAVFVSSPSPELTARVCALAAGELARRALGGACVEAKDLDAAKARAKGISARALARISVALDRGALSARGELYSLWENFWAGRQASTAAGSPVPIDAATPVDAYALALLAPQPSVPGPTKLSLVPSLLGRFPSWLLAVAAGDVDGDGADEVVAVTDDEVLVLNAQGRVLARKEHASLQPAAARVRDPIAAAAVVGGQVAYFHAGRARGEQLAYAAGELTLVKSLDQVPLAGGAAWGRWVPGQSALTSDLFANQGPLWSLASYERAGRTDFVATLSSGQAAWTRGATARTEIIPNVGVSALCDLDGDGAPELVTTTVAVAADKDELAAYPDAPWGTAPMWQATVPGGRAMQLCGARAGKGKEQQLVVSVWLPNGTSELYLYRRVAP